MRKILFRGKSAIYKDWVYGYLVYSEVDDEYCIIRSDDVEIDGHHIKQKSERPVLTYQKTISQFTGLYDKNGIGIYEGDIVIQQGYHGKKIPMVVKFECGAFIVGYHEGSSTKRRPMLLNSQCEVIGNIYDNPELVEE